MDPYPKSTQYLAEFVKWLAPDSPYKFLQGFALQIIVQGEQTDVHFAQSEFDDFEIALEQYKDTDYFYTLANRLRFRIAIALGAKGLIPYLKISSEFLRERGDWLKSAAYDVAFEEDFCKLLVDGLRLLAGSIATTLSTDIKVPDMEREKNRVDGLVEIYEKRGHFTERNVSIESLSYLKAAILCVIMEREKAAQGVRIPRVRKALDAEIYDMVSRLRAYPFGDIKLPEAMRDYVILQESRISQQALPPASKPTQVDDETELDKRLVKHNPRWKERRQGAWQTFYSNNPDRLSQAANSMVELLNQVIDHVSKGTEFATFLAQRYKAHQESTDFVITTRKWISDTKSTLHKMKHHVDSQSEQLTKALLQNAETIITMILDDGFR